MVDAIGVNRIATADIVRTTAVTNASATAETVQSDPVQTAHDTATSVSIALSKTLAATPPVDVNRVAEIRRAIADGTFPILPATIADRMLALKLDWTTHDKA